MKTACLIILVAVPALSWMANLTVEYVKDQKEGGNPDMLKKGTSSTIYFIITVAVYYFAGIYDMLFKW